MGRIRFRFICKSEGKTDALSRQPVVVENDIHAWTDGGSSAQVEESSGGLPAGGERKTIFSVENSVKKCSDGDEEQRTHQKISNEPRSGSSYGVSVISKFRGSSQPTGSSTWTEYVFHTSNDWDRTAALTKKALSQGNNKLYIQKKNQVGSHNLVTNGKASNGMQLASGVKTVESLSNSLPTHETLNEWKPLPCSNMYESTSLDNIQHHVKRAENSSYPMNQFAGQRPQKFSPKWREDLVSSASDNGKVPISSEASPVPDNSTRLLSSGGNEPFVSRTDCGAGENNLKKVEDRAAGAVQKVSSLLGPVRKNKLVMKEESRGILRKGLNERGVLVSGESVRQEKLEKQPTANSLQNMKSFLNKTRRKRDGSPLKKLLDCDAYKIPRIAFNSVCSDIKGESDDDNEELIEAANYACCVSYHVCSSPFWKRIEPIFAPVSKDDATYLHKQLNLEESDGTDCLNLFDEHNASGDEHALPQTIVSGEGQGDQRNGIGSNKLGTVVDSVEQLQGTNSSSGGLNAERSVENVPSLIQLLLSALIVEVDAEGANHGNENKNATSQSATEYHPSDKSICFSVKPNEGDMMNIEAVEIANDPNDVLTSEVEMTCQSPQYNSETCVSEIEYQNMSLNERCLLELQCIGIYPKAEEIDKDIAELWNKRYQKLSEKQVQISKLEQLVLAGEAEGCDRERIALNRLVETAYRKCMVCSSRKATTDLKQKATAFAERTIGRCREYEKTGASCFSEPALIEIMSSAPQCSNVANLGETESDTTVFSTGLKQYCPYGQPPSGEAFAKFQPKSTRVRKRKAPDVIGNADSIIMLADSEGSGKGRTSKKDRDLHESVLTTDSSVKASIQTGDSQLPKSGNADLDHVTGTIHSVPPALETSNGTTVTECTKVSEAALTYCSDIHQGSTAKKNELTDIEELNLPNLDKVDLGLPDFSSQANLDEAVLHDCDSVGLAVPMDDLSDLNIFF